MGMLDSFFNPGKAYKKAQKVANAGYDRANNAATQGYGEAQGYLKPYMRQGQDQYGRLMEAENQLMNPEDLYAKWANNYQQSPFAQQALNENMEQGQEAASQMGLNGSSAALSNIQQGAGNIVNKDREGFLTRLMESYLKGIGLGHDIYNTGANAGGLASGNAMTFGTDNANRAFEHGNNIAGLKYGEQASPGQAFGQLLGGIGNIAAGAAGTPGVQNWLGSANKFNPWATATKGVA